MNFAIDFRGFLSSDAFHLKRIQSEITVFHKMEKREEIRLIEGNRLF